MTPLEVADAFILFAFVIGLTLTVARLSWRLVQYHRRRIPWPRLAARDIIAFGGLLVPFLLILMARAAGLDSLVADELSWRVMTGVPALAAVWTLAYFEWVVIERE